MLVSRIIIDILIITLQICLFLKNNTSIHLQIHLTLYTAIHLKSKGWNICYFFHPYVYHYGILLYIT